ncbi:MAG: hypothetical protein LUC85_01265 [Bacteroidales bacterium]|nr:hypothetical protein [Bacteroidales bacterium]
MAAPQQGAPVIVNNIVEKKSNSLGTAGFVLAILALVFCWVPVLDWILWFLGALFSVIGLFKSPRGLAIAGTVISFIGVIIMIALVGAIMAAM